MDNSDNSNSVNFDFGIDLESNRASTLKERLIKFKTMGDKDQIQEIELSSEFSQYEESAESETENNQVLPTTGIYSESGFKKEKSFPKLMKASPTRKASTESLSDSSPLKPAVNKRYLHGHRNITLESESMDDAVSIKTRKEVQKEQLGNLAFFILKLSWFVIY